MKTERHSDSPTIVSAKLTIEYSDGSSDTVELAPEVAKVAGRGTTERGFARAWYAAAQVAKLTGLSTWCINEACRAGNIKGAYKRKPYSGSPWIIPGASAQRYFDEIRGLVR